MFEKVPFAGKKNVHVSSFDLQFHLILMFLCWFFFLSGEPIFFLKSHKFLFNFVVLGIEPRASIMVGKYFTNELDSPVQKFRLTILSQSLI
jgi:hypothetical protein